MVPVPLSRTSSTASRGRWGLRQPWSGEIVALTSQRSRESLNILEKSARQKSSLELGHCKTAAYTQNLTGDVGGVLRQEKSNRGGLLFWLRSAPKGDVPHYPIDHFLI
jgi:hypothetical protein